MKRNLGLTQRLEAVRESKSQRVPTHFTPLQIIEHFNESIREIEEQFSIADQLIQSGNVPAAEIIWRSQVVLSEGLLDYYIHEVSKYCLFQMFCGNWNKSEKYENIMVPISKLEEAVNTVESNDWFFEYVNTIYSRDVFLSAESMKTQLNLIGVPFTKVMERVFPEDKQQNAVKKGSQLVSKLFNRRNKIAHQNDRNHEDANQEIITKEYVEEYISNIKSIVENIQAIINEINESTND